LIIGGGRLIACSTTTTLGIEIISEFRIPPLQPMSIPSDVCSTVSALTNYGCVAPGCKCGRADKDAARTAATAHVSTGSATTAGDDEIVNGRVEVHAHVAREREVVGDLGDAAAERDVGIAD
jgi:hypothetical protein